MGMSWVRSVVYGAQHHAFDAGFDSRVATLFSFLFCIRRFLTVYGSYFALSASGGSCGGLTTFVHLMGGGRVPNGITSGWDQVRIGSRSQAGPCFVFPL